MEMTHRPATYRKQRQFVKGYMRKAWSHVYRISLKTVPEGIRQWCVENTIGNWSCTDDCRLFYFEHDVDIVLFRLRWGGEVLTDYSNQLKEK